MRKSHSLQSNQKGVTIADEDFLFAINAADEGKDPEIPVMLGFERDDQRLQRKPVENSWDELGAIMPKFGGFYLLELHL